MNKDIKPEILAPAGNRASFAAAIAAGADGIYCGLKNFSARMEADNFSIEELASMTALAHSKKVKVYVAFNSVIKSSDLQRAANLIDKLARHVKPDALIVSDPAFSMIAKKVGFKGELHLSTLANLSFSQGLKTAASLGFSRVVVPRELNIDEIKQMSDNCPEAITLEAFIHGALCYGVSGRCYWSSWFGGKSGLRGRCVQPCRRVYEKDGGKERFFSCQDLSLDVLVRVLQKIKNVKTWKIEGRKKGPHYVYYTVLAYKMLRDHGDDPAKRKNALELLDQALGRPLTHYGFLPQRPQNPVDTSKQTGSGRFVGSVKGPFKQPFLKPRENLIAGDLLRIGYEDSSGHQIYKIRKSVPKNGKINLKFQEKVHLKSNSPVFLIDRREQELNSIISQFEKDVEKFSGTKITPSKSNFHIGTGKRKWKGNRSTEMTVERKPDKKNSSFQKGIWVTEENAQNIPSRFISGYWWWLPPVIWPENEALMETIVQRIINKGGKKFVLNAPWQISLFKQEGSKAALKLEKLTLWAGPFCNIANEASIEVLSQLGFKGVVADPELSGEDFLNLPLKSPLPLGIVLTANWPLSIARTIHDESGVGKIFKSPMGEASTALKIDNNFYIYPDWRLDIRKKRRLLEKAGYTLFISIEERLEKQTGLKMKKRSGLWNWDLKLL